jgi:ATP-dependent exoDNAse (exonuclease V) beta subunit
VFGFRPDGAARIESLRLVLEAIPVLEGAGIESLPELVHWLRGRSADAPLALGELDAAGADAVNLLTIHKAKGLEFPIVILADLGGGYANPSPVVADRGASRLEFRLPRTPEIASPGFAEANEREHMRRRAEDVRLLYVATTRARDHLVLAWSEESGGFLAKNMLPERLGATPGSLPSADWDLGVLRAADLPPRERARSVHTVDVERVLAELAGTTSGDLFAAPRPGERTERPAIVAATAVAQAAARRFVGDPSARGDEADDDSLDARAVGVLVHAALQTIEAGPPKEAVAAALDRAIRHLDGTVSPDERARVGADLERIVRDPVLAALRERFAAERGAFREVPFLLPFGDQLLSGTIDVLLEQEDGSLILIDYKTGRAPTGHVLPAHRAQMALYAWAAESITGRTVREARLLFLGADPVRAMVLPGDELLREAAELLPPSLRGARC